MWFRESLSIVMAGRVPAIHDLLAGAKTWMPATSAGMTEERLVQVKRSVR
jgi:hypothetical protein